MNKKSAIAAIGILIVLILVGSTILVTRNTNEKKSVTAEQKDETQVEKSPEIQDEKEEKNTNSESLETAEIKRENKSFGRLDMSFDFNRAGTEASNQYAVWIENEVGEIVRTLYISRFTAQGGYAIREDAVPTWVDRFHPSEKTEELDAMSGATPQTGKVTYEWDGTDDNGNEVPFGIYKFYVEGTLYWSSSVLFSGTFEMGAMESGNISVDAEYTENTDTNRNMIENVTATYIAE